MLDTVPGSTLVYITRRFIYPSLNDVSSRRPEGSGENFQPHYCVQSQALSFTIIKIITASKNEKGLVIALVDD